MKKHVDLSLVEEKSKRHHVLIENVNTFMYYHILHHGEKHFCCYYLQALNTAEILKRHIKDFFKINGKLNIIMLKKS